MTTAIGRGRLAQLAIVDESTFGTPPGAGYIAPIFIRRPCARRLASTPMRFWA